MPGRGGSCGSDVMENRPCCAHRGGALSRGGGACAHCVRCALKSNGRGPGDGIPGLRMRVRFPQRPRDGNPWASVEGPLREARGLPSLGFDEEHALAQCTTRPRLGHACYRPSPNPTKSGGILHDPVEADRNRPKRGQKPCTFDRFLLVFLTRERTWPTRSPLTARQARSPPPRAKPTAAGRSHISILAATLDPPGTRRSNKPTERQREGTTDATKQWRQRSGGAALRPVARRVRLAMAAALGAGVVRGPLLLAPLR